MPFSSFDANAAAWMEIVLAAEPHTLRYRLLHVAGRLVHRARQTWPRLPEHWPWTSDLLTAYRRLAAIT